MTATDEPMDVRPIELLDEPAPLAAPAPDNSDVLIEFESDDPYVADDRVLPLLAIGEARSTRVIWLIALAIVTALYGFAIFSFWAPADGGIDQNAYLVGGKMIAQHGTPRLDLPNPFAYAGQMFILSERDSSSLYPKYPFGLPLLFAIVTWIFGRARAATWAFAVSPACAIAAVVGMYFLARKIAGSFAALLAAILLATSQIMWELADVSNSHAACVAFVVFGMLALVNWWQRGTWWRGLLAGFLLGYACTIRYSEGLLILPIGLVAIYKMRWRDARSNWRNAAPVIGWLVPVLTLLIYTRISLGDWTGYDSSNESVVGESFTWSNFTGKWELMLRTLHDQGLFFVLPLSVVGLIMLFARNWRLATVLLAWLLPGVALYTSYYWSPDRGVAYGRFFLTFFPAFLVGFAAFVQDGIYGQLSRDALTLRSDRGRRAALAVCAGVAVAIAAGVASWRVIQPDESGGPFSESLPVQFQQRAALAQTGKIARQLVPAGSILFAEEGRMGNSPANYLQFAGDWDLFSLTALENRGGRGGRMFTPDANNPTPMQPKRRDATRALYANKSDRDLVVEQNRLLDAAFAEGQRVFVLAPPVAIDTFRRHYLPMGKYAVSPITRWTDPIAPPDAAAAAPRRNLFGMQTRLPNPPMNDQRPTEWRLVEIKLVAHAISPPKPLAIVPATIPSPATRPLAPPGTQP